ncbi:MAG TPA: rod shape-determining protein MreD [Geminicoccaceae bacterium]|nr:rod shape-determining protein MreD [Geminicoccaceae bacterium]
MIEGALARRLDLGLRRQIPLATALLAVQLDLLPVPDPSPQSLAPFATLCVVYYWGVYRPDLMTPLATFVIGLTLDLLAGGPLGFNALILTLAVGLMAPRQKALVAASPLVIWLCFGLLALVVAVVRWLVASLWWGRLFALEPLLYETGLTVVLYPLASALLTRLQARLPRIGHASGS